MGAQMPVEVRAFDTMANTMRLDAKRKPQFDGC
jgi:hypothetical protein